jgi:hypothetical protein
MPTAPPLLLPSPLRAKTLGFNQPSASDGPTHYVVGGWAKVSTDDGSDSSTTPNFTLPQNLQTGDFGIAVLSTNSGSVTLSSPPAGWTVHGSSPVASSTTLEAWLMTKSLTEADSGVNQSATLSATGRWTASGIVVRGSNQAIDSYNSNSITATTVNLAHETVTPTVDGTIRATLIAWRRADSAQHFATVPSSVWAKQVDITSAQATSPHQGAVIDTTQLGAGTAGVTQAAVNGTLDLACTYVGFHLTIAPATASIAVTGTAAVTTADDTSTADGVVANPVTGTVAVTTGDDTSAASALETITGTVAVTTADDTSAASGTETITGTSAVTTANDTSAVTAVETFTGTAVVTTANDVSAVVALETFTGTLAKTTGDDVSTASGSVGGGAPVTGSLAVTTANDTSTASAATVTVNWFKTPTVKRLAGQRRLYNLYTFNKGVSVVLIDGHYRRYPIPPHTLLVPLVAGRDYFIGGTAAVVVSSSVAAALTADGFTVYDHNPDA